jgi:hypothetical protein
MGKILPLSAIHGNVNEAQTTLNNPVNKKWLNAKISPLGVE